MNQKLKRLDEGGWEWIDLQNPSAEELQAIADDYRLHPASVKDCLQPEHLPKYEIFKDYVFIIVRVLDQTPHPEADTIQELTSKIAIFFTGTYIITIHRHAQPVIQEVKSSYLDTELVQTPMELLLKLIRAAFKTYEAPAQKLAYELDYYEARIFLHRNPPPLTKGLYHIKRRAAVSRRVLHLSEVILDSLQINGAHAPDLQDLVDLFVRVETMYDEINDSTNNLMNIYISMSSQKTNEVMRVLTIFSVFFMPLTFIAGIYGMNFEFMPELQARYGYPLTMFAMVLVTVSIYLWFRRKGWM